MLTDRGYRKRRKRYEDGASARYLTFSCFHNRPFLLHAQACEWLAEGIRTAKTRHAFDLWAWVFMPEHVHLLLRPGEGIEVGTLLRAIKEPFSKRYAAWARREAPHLLGQLRDVQPNGKQILRFWQRGGGYDRNIWSETELREKINYIHANLIRRGLVASPGEWDWSSYRAWESGTDLPLALDRGSLELFSA